MITPTPLQAPGVARHRLAVPRLSSEDRRRQLLKHAVALFSQRGFSGTRTKDIAAACGVSEGILFRHFATKEDLYQAILANYKNEAGADEWLAAMKRLAAARDDAGFVQSLTRHVFRWFRDDPAFHRLMLYARLDGHLLADMMHEQMGLPAMGVLRDYVAQRQREGAFRSGDPMAMALFMASSAWQQATSKYVFQVDMLTMPDEQRIEQLSEMILAGLRATPAAPTRSAGRTSSTSSAGRAAPTVPAGGAASSPNRDRKGADRRDKKVSV